MRTLARNKQVIEYSNPTGELEAVLDEYGYETGDYELGYEPRQSAWVNISPPLTEVDRDVFGLDLTYDLVLVVEYLDITEEARVWFRNNEYMVIRVAESLNHLRIALRRVV